MPINNARGLVPARRQDGSPPSPANLYPTGSNRNILMIGDAVFLNADRKIQRYDQQTSANGPGVLGVVVGLFDSNKKPLTHVSEKKISVSGSGWVSVIDDPDCLYQVQCSASVGPSQIGHFCTLATVGTSPGVTANGKSGFALNETTVVTAAGHPFQLYSICDLEGAGPNNDVLVRISNHNFRRSTRLIGPLEAADA
jgi:hypothetical protein